ncbi:MAG: CAP domain-containing protein [Terriglobales bacterium]
MTRCLIATLVVLVALSGPAVAENHPAETGVDSGMQNQQPTSKLTAAASDEDAAAEAALLESINQSRQLAGAAPVRMDETLREAARLHALHMVSSRRLEHQFPGEPSLLQRIADVSSLPLDRAGENIANVGCADDAHDLLMHSPPHRANILDARFNTIGIAAIWSHGRLFVVQDFGHALPSYSAREIAQRVGEALDQARASAGLPELAAFAPPHLDEAACALAKGDHPNARLLAASYTNRKVITYTQGSPEVLPSAALSLLENPNLHHFAVGSCYARNATYPTGIYWVAILLY